MSPFLNLASFFAYFAEYLTVCSVVCILELSWLGSDHIAVCKPRFTIFQMSGQKTDIAFLYRRLKVSTIGFNI